MVWDKQNSNNYRCVEEPLDYENFCSQILEINPKIRFAAVYDSWAKRIAWGLRKGLHNPLSEHDENELFLR